MKRHLLLVLILSLSMFILGSCGAKTLHCDGCGKELKVANSSNMEEDWIVFCKDCEEEVFGDEPLVSEE